MASRKDPHSRLRRRQAATDSGHGRTARARSARGWADADGCCCRIAADSCSIAGGCSWRVARARLSHKQQSPPKRALSGSSVTQFEMSRRQVAPSLVNATPTRASPLGASACHRGSCTAGRAAIRSFAATDWKPRSHSPGISRSGSGSENVRARSMAGPRFVWWEEEDRKIPAEPVYPWFLSCQGARFLQKFLHS